MTRNEKLVIGGLVIAGVITGGVLFVRAQKAKALPPAPPPGPPAPQGPQTITVTTANSGQSVGMHVGDVLVLELPYDTSHTMTWSAPPEVPFLKMGQSIVDLSGKNAIVSTSFTAMAPGSTVLVSNLTMASQTSPLATFTLTVRVT